MNPKFLISQQEAFEVLKDMPELSSLGLRAKDLCGASALHTAFNLLWQEKRFGPREVAEFYRQGMLLHKKKHFIPPELKDRFPQGWLVFTKDKAVYHHALLWWAKKQGVKGENLEGNLNLKDFGEFLKEGGVVLLSLPNKIVNLRGGKEVKLAPGTHIVVLEKIEENVALLADPFQKEEEEKKECIFYFPLKKLQELWEETGTRKALAFSLFPSLFSLLPPCSAPKLFVPEV